MVVKNAIIKTSLMLFYKKTLFSSLAAAALFAVGALPLSAQTAQPQFLMTWSAKSYVPTGYAGKAFPTAGSPVTVSFELVNQGKVVDLSKQTIYWYVNEGVLDGTANKQTISFLAPSSVPGLIDVEVQLPNYQNSILVHSIRIPVVTPRAVIESRYPGGNFTSPAFEVSALPYFFNTQSASSLNFTWNVNGENAPSAENPEDLKVGLNADAPTGSAVTVGLTVVDANNSESTAITGINLTYIK